MIVTVASYKGGVGKTITAVHLAAYLQTLAPTLLLDADRRTKNALNWSKRGKGFPFQTAPDVQAAKLAAQFKHMVIDTGQGATEEDLQAAAEACDVLVIPLTPEFLDKDAQVQMFAQLQQITAKNYRVLLTRVASYKAREAARLRTDLEEMGVPVFHAEIPRLEVFDKAAGIGGTVQGVTGDKNAVRAWDAYAAAAKELMQ